MSIEYADGTFSENFPIEEAFDRFREALEEGTARALHVGTNRELRNIKTKKRIEDRVSELEERLKPLEAAPLKSENIIIPTREEMIAVLRKRTSPPMLSGEDIEAWEGMKS